MVISTVPSGGPFIGPRAAGQGVGLKGCERFAFAAGGLVAAAMAGSTPRLAHAGTPSVEGAVLGSSSTGSEADSLSNALRPLCGIDPILMAR
jgi:hypothetical protein